MLDTQLLKSFDLLSAAFSRGQGSLLLVRWVGYLGNTPKDSIGNKSSGCFLVWKIKLAHCVVNPTLFHLQDLGDRVIVQYIQRQSGSMVGNQIITQDD